MTSRVAHLEAMIEEVGRATSNRGSTVRAESDGGRSGVQAETGSSVHAGPPPVFTVTEPLSSARTELPLLTWTTPTKDNLLDLEQADSGLPARAGEHEAAAKGVPHRLSSRSLRAR